MLGLPVRVWEVELVVTGTEIVTIVQVIVIEAVSVVVIVMVALTATATLFPPVMMGTEPCFPNRNRQTELT